MSVRGWDEIGNYFPGTGNARMNRMHVVSSLREPQLLKDGDQIVVSIWHLLNA